MEMDLDGTKVTLGGIAKGSGMIHPNMATMLALLTCDAAVEPATWTQMVRRASTRSFNAVRGLAASCRARKTQCDCACIGVKACKCY